jgi:hypothetical protein
MLEEDQEVDTGYFSENIQINKKKFNFYDNINFPVNFLTFMDFLIFH